MSSGKAVRLSRLMARDGKICIAALDHGWMGIQPLAALEDPAPLLDLLVRAGVDAVIVTPGTLLRFPGAFRGLGVVLRVDCGPTAHTGAWERTQPAFSPEDALRMGADAVIAMGIVGAEGEPESLRALGELSAECDRWGVPLVAEMLPGGFTASSCPPDLVCSAARIGADAGGDIVKIRYSGSKESFRALTRSCYRPVVILGGSAGDPAQLLRTVEDAMAAGGAGVAVGRNIWQAQNPAQIAAGLAAIVHGREPALLP